ncbi:MAG: aldo/keto reductase [Candidatus Thorarchaeota archaeon]
MTFATLKDTDFFSERSKKNSNIHSDNFSKNPYLNLILSSIGMGTYLGSPDNKTDDLVISAVKKSVQNGVNVFDTAINYRWQKGERSLGKALNDLFKNGYKREEFFISSKIGYIPGDADQRLDPSSYLQEYLIKNDVISSGDVIDDIHSLAIKFLDNQFNNSLKNLNIDGLDLLYLHNAAESQVPIIGKEKFLENIKKAFFYLEEQRKKQKIHYYGLATWNCFTKEPNETGYLSLYEINDLAESIGGKNHGFKSVQLPINIKMLEPIIKKNQSIKETNHTFLEAAQELGIAVFASVPLYQGRLLTKINLTEGIDLGLSPAQICLQFVRSAPNVIPLVGHKQPKHVEENLKLLNFPKLSPEKFKTSFM